MSGFPACEKEVMIKFHVIDALYNKGIESATVKTTISSGEKSGSTDEGGFVTIGPFTPGDEITVDIEQAGYDKVHQVVTVDEDTDAMMLGLNPTGPDLRLVLTWGPQPSDLDSRVKFFNTNGDEVCKLYWNNKKCDEYASLDVDETNGGNNGPETITIKNVPEGVKVMYYVYDYSNKIGRSMSWADSDAKGTVFGPNNGGTQIVPLDADQTDDGKRYFVIGCFDHTGYPGFVKVGQAATDSTNHC